MEQLTLFDPVDKSQHGATWWAGNWQCRNNCGFFQQREGGAGPWQFVVHGFGENDASVYAINHKGHLIHARCAMDDKDNLIVRGRRYGRTHWCH